MRCWRGPATGRCECRQSELACLTVGCLLSGCSNHPPTYQGPATSAAGPRSAGATAMRGGELGALTARGLVDALAEAGFAVPNPLDTTAQVCPAAGCDQSIVTDTLRIKSFANTSGAQSYAGDHGLFQVETIVVAFAASVLTALPVMREMIRCCAKMKTTSSACVTTEPTGSTTTSTTRPRRSTQRRTL